MKQTQIQTFSSFQKPPLPKGYSTSHILTKRKCGYKFLLAYIYKAKGQRMEHLQYGSDVHEDISKGNFESDNPETQKLLDVARTFLEGMPANPIFETSIKDKNNPGTYKGRIFDQPFLGVFDVHWVEERIGVDWKSGSFHEDRKNDYEIQAYVLNELFMQRHGHYLRKFVFVFLKDGYQYEAECITDARAWKRKGNMIQNALDSIKKLEFEKRVSFSCQWCEYQGMCI